MLNALIITHQLMLNLTLTSFYSKVTIICTVINSKIASTIKKTKKHEDLPITDPRIIPYPNTLLAVIFKQGTEIILKQYIIASKCFGT